MPVVGEVGKVDAGESFLQNSSIGAGIAEISTPLLDIRVNHQLGGARVEDRREARERGLDGAREGGGDDETDARVVREGCSEVLSLCDSGFGERRVVVVKILGDVVGGFAVPEEVNEAELGSHFVVYGAHGFMVF